MTDAVPAGPVLLMAFACEPGRGSEPGVGAAFAAAGARLAREDGRRVVLVTRPHRVAEIRAALGADAAHLEILPVPLPRAVVRATGRRRVRWAYVLWQLRAVLRVRRLLRHERSRAVVHHVTFATEALPTFEGLLRRRAAIVFGPAGSTAVTGGGLRGILRRGLRAVGARSTLGPASLLVATNDHVGRSWSSHGAPVVVEPNVFVEGLTSAPPDAEWDAMTAGLLIPRKRVELAIRAFARSGSTGRMLVVGDGPERARLEHEAARAGVAHRIVFAGALTRAATLEAMTRSRVLLHPSRQEGAGWVVGEAQAAGAWPIVFTGGGADGTVRAAGSGTVVEGTDADAMAAALDAALRAPRPAPSNRWSTERLPDLLRDWYSRALAQRG